MKGTRKRLHGGVWMYNRCWPKAKMGIPVFSKPGKATAEEKDNQKDAMKPLTRILSRFVLLLAFLGVAFPQTAQIAGTITDSTGARVPEAVLTVRSIDTGV